MILRALVSFSGPEVGAPSPGDLFECPDASVECFIAAGVAERVVGCDKPKPAPRKVKANKDV
jgi:hypothetical protein